MAKALNDLLPDPVRYHVHHPRLHRRPDDLDGPQRKGDLRRSRAALLTSFRTAQALQRQSALLFRN